VASGTFSQRILVAASLAAGIFLAPATAAAQNAPCVDPGPDQAGETPIFTGSDHDDRVFTLSQNKETGAWTLVVISEFQKDAGGLEIGRPCVMVLGRDSKLLDALPPTEAVANDAQPAPEAVQPGGKIVASVASADSVAEGSAAAETDAETYRVTRLGGDEILDIRTGPGTDFESIAQVPADEGGVAVTADSCKAVDGYQHPWCEVAWGGHKGWASACCLEGERTGLKLE